MSILFDIKKYETKLCLSPRTCFQAIFIQTRPISSEEPKLPLQLGKNTQAVRESLSLMTGSRNGDLRLSVSSACKSYTGDKYYSSARLEKFRPRTVRARAREKMGEFPRKLTSCVPQLGFLVP